MLSLRIVSSPFSVDETYYCLVVGLHTRQRYGTQPVSGSTTPGLSIPVHAPVRGANASCTVVQEFITSLDVSQLQDL
jgi:hypothetical protein